MSFSASYIYRLQDKMTPIMNKMERASQKFTENLSTGAYKVSQKFKNFGDELTGLKQGLIAVGSIKILKSAISGADEFDTSFRRVQMRLQGTTEEIALLRNQAIGMAKTYHYSGAEVAGVQEMLLKEQFNVNQIMKATPAIMAMATNEKMDYGQAVKGVADILGGFQISEDKAARVTDALSLATKHGGGELSEYMNSLAMVSPMANQAGVGFEDMTKMILMANKAGIDGARAGSIMTAMIMEMSRTSPLAVKSLRKLGIDPRSIKDSQGKIKDMTGLMMQVKENGGKVGDFINIFGRRAGLAIMGMAEKGGGALADFSKDMANTSGVNEILMNDLMAGSDGALKRFGSSVDHLRTRLGEQLMPTFVAVTEKVGGWIAWIGDLNPMILKTVGYILALITVTASATFAIGTVALVIGQVASAIPLVISGLGLMKAAMLGVTKVMAQSLIWLATNPIGWVILAIGAVAGAVYLIYKNWDWVKTKVVSAINYIADNWKKFAIGLAIISPALALITMAIVAVYKNWDKIVDGMQIIWKQWSEGVVFVSNAVFDGIGSAIDWVSSKFGVFVEWLSSALAPAFAPFVSIGETIMKVWQDITGIFGKVSDAIDNMPIIKNLFGKQTAPETGGGFKQIESAKSVAGTLASTDTLDEKKVKSITEIENIKAVKKEDKIGHKKAVDVNVKNDIGGVLKIEIDNKGNAKIKENKPAGNLGFQVGT